LPGVDVSTTSNSAPVILVQVVQIVVVPVGFGTVDRMSGGRLR
jgi:hypothetical protein